MRKLSSQLLVCSLLLSSIPYGMFNNMQQAEAVEDSQSLELNGQKENVATEVLVEETTEELPVESSDTSGEIKNTSNETSIASETKVVENVATAVERTPRRSSDFMVTVDGNILTVGAGAEEYYYLNAQNISFTRSDSFSSSFTYEIDKNGGSYVPLTAVGNNEIVNLGIYSEEGIYSIIMVGYTSGNRTDTGFLNNLVQRTKAEVNVENVINNPSTVVENPTTITVGKDAQDIYGDYTYTWVINGPNGVTLTGTDRQPTKEEISSLPIGEYTISNTVTETTPPEYGSVEIPDTAQGAFVITGGTLIVEHILLDKDGNKVRTHSTETTTDKLGVNYQTSAATILGYELVQTKLPLNATGQYQTQDQTVTYYYQKIKTDIVTKHLDEQGNVLAPSETTTGEYEDPYSTTSKEITGYELTEVPVNAEGAYGTENKEVIYVYKKVPTVVTVNHVDRNGNKLADSVTIDGVYQEDYNTQAISIPGYMLIELPVNAIGNHTVEPTEVTYVYAKIVPPTVKDTLEGSNTVTGSGVPGKEVIVTLPDGSKHTVSVDENGNWTLAVPEGVYLKKGDIITAVTHDPLTGMISTEGAGKVIPMPVTAGKNVVKPKSTLDTNSNSSQQINSSKTSAKLPATGEQTTIWYQIVGSVMLLILGMFKIVDGKKYLKK